MCISLLVTYTRIHISPSAVHQDMQVEGQEREITNDCELEAY